MAGKPTVRTILRLQLILKQYRLFRVQRAQFISGIFPEPAWTSPCFRRRGYSWMTSQLALSFLRQRVPWTGSC